MPNIVDEGNNWPVNLIGTTPSSAGRPHCFNPLKYNITGPREGEGHCLGTQSHSLRLCASREISCVAAMVIVIAPSRRKNPLRCRAGETHCATTLEKFIASPRGRNIIGRSWSLIFSRPNGRCSRRSMSRLNMLKSRTKMSMPGRRALGKGLKWRQSV